ncbi:helix-turn-helix transcriptional regulator [Streptacidiphilus sp. P02-A3a]|uniref:ArsR/SmtB family transcription factor n=1 Tax=Streptacidiphilus sp. P02-A3a TaxID=2704468 RepID=UPI0015FBD314|nr:metalloregulator ArsR/SmtB family transcription factor [Streptacidiphilus sp. P02-A3a]QMU68911.1 metalloregulator ArsR/SmtB family transcription factor [Streptacidiphilus sp. P02-A3a]
MATEPDPLSTVFAALADPTRRAILARLASGEATVTELAEPFAMSLPAVSKHLKVLERAGLITRGRSAQWRPCRLEAEPLGEASAWLERYRRLWERSFDRLADHLAERMAELQDEAGTAAGQQPDQQPDQQPRKHREKERDHD